MACTRTTARTILLASLAIASTPALGQRDIGQDYQLPVEPLASTLNAIAHRSGIQILFASSVVDGRQAPALVGHYTPQAALVMILKGSGLVAVPSGDAILIQPGKAAEPESNASAAPRDAIVVTGTRIKGQAVASPVIIRTQEQIRSEGLTSVADAVRALPQNFSGGQNPGVAIGAGGSPDNENVSSGSSINLRGIGQDATLTLLNGHRLAYSVNAQGVDISTIPLAALDRIEVVADGSSALYGSDAVGGVANILLKPDYGGLTTSTRLGSSTDGGDFQQQYDLVGGTRWSNGGFIATYDFERDTAVDAGHRSYTAVLNPSETLLPYSRHHSAIVSGHQEIVPDLVFSVDGTFNTRWSNLNFAVAPTGDVRDFGLIQSSHNSSYSVAPKLTWTTGPWTLSTEGVYASDHTHYAANVYFDQAVISPSRGCYCSTFKNVEANAEGPLVHLPAGDIRAAFGGGYRSNGFHGYRTEGDPQDISIRQNTYYAYGEVGVPLVRPEQALRFVHRLSLSGAVRYEDYPGAYRVTTPKLGLIYAPSEWLDIKASWGKSFKAPTLYQQYSTQGATLFPISALGGSHYPDTATGVELSGANPALKPERATTWTATLALHPFAGFEAEVSYFRINYHDRVLEPIPITSDALSNPAYRTLVNLAPSDAEKTASVDGAYSLNNETGGPVDIANIVAIVDDRYHNIARQKIDGVDGSVRYKRPVAANTTIGFDADVSYLRSAEILGPGEPSVPLAGTIFNPPHWRGRAGISVDRGTLTLTSYANYIGHVSDNQLSPASRVASMTTLDLAIRYRVTSGSGLLGGLDIIAAAQNLLNAKPDVIATDVSYYVPYDSTNYSAVGRFLSLTISKTW